MKYLKITQVRSINGDSYRHRATVRSLGLRKRGQTVVHEESAQIKGMIKSVQHLVTVESLAAKPATETTKSVSSGYQVTKAKKTA